jgi:hypothetical protein
MAIDAKLFGPCGITLDSCNNIFVCDAQNSRIRKIEFPYCNFLGITENVVPQETNVYPNPVSDLLQIDHIAIHTNYRLQNIMGATLQQGMLKEGSNSISLSTLPTGMYLMEMIDDEGNRTVKKIIKE